MTDNDTEPRSPFSAILAKYDQSELRAAFVRAKNADGKNYDRTSLYRWLDGSVPKDGDFIQHLGHELGDSDLYPAWEQTSQRRTRATKASAHPTPDSVEDQYEALSHDDRQQAYPNIRRLYLERFTELRTGASYRVELRDGPTANFREVRVTIEWDGSLPADARAIYTTEDNRLGDAFQDRHCLFRETLAIDNDHFADLLETWPDQILTWNPIGVVNPHKHRHIATNDGDGTFQFDNDAAEDARITLSLTYPYPKGLGVFFIRFGNYRFEGGAHLFFTLNATGAHSPKVFTYLPAGRQREFAANLGRTNELVITLGSAGTILTDGDGATLYWTESSP